MNRPASGPMLRDITPPILVVDDDPTLLSIVSDLLALEGLRVERASNGMDALKAVERLKPSLVLLDMRMPGVDGWEFARKLRDQDDSIPIIVMTAAEDASGWAEQIGAAAYLPKPFDVDTLLSTVDRLRRRGDDSQQ